MAPMPRGRMLGRCPRATPRIRSRGVGIMRTIHPPTPLALCGTTACLPRHPPRQVSPSRRTQQHVGVVVLKRDRAFGPIWRARRRLFGRVECAAPLNRVRARHFSDAAASSQAAPTITVNVEEPGPHAGHTRTHTVRAIALQPACSAKPRTAASPAHLLSLWVQRRACSPRFRPRRSLRARSSSSSRSTS